MKNNVTAFGLLIFSLLLVCLPVLSTDVGIGGFAHIWGEYPSGEFGFLERYSYTAGPLISFVAGLTVWDFWYGVDPIQNGWIGDQPEPIASGEVKVYLDELGWRVSLASPLFVSASYSRLRCAVTPVPCNTQYVTGGWLANQITAGGGVRIGPFWGLVEAGVRWWNWQSVPGEGEPVETGLYLSSGFAIPTSSISSHELRHTVESLSIALEETFPLSCDEWDWVGQSGRITILDEQLSIQVKEQGQRVMQRFCCDEGRFVLDLDISPFSSYNARHFFGVVLRYEDDNNFYALDVRADGYIRFTKALDGRLETVVPWRRTAAYEPGEINHLRVIAPGNKFVFYLNDRRILSVPEVSFTKGDVGVFAGTAEESGTWVAFDNLAIRAIPPNTLLDPRTERTKEFERVERIGLAILGAVGAYASFSEGYNFFGYSFTAAALYELLSESAHLIQVE